MKTHENYSGDEDLPSCIEHVLDKYAVDCSDAVVESLCRLYFRVFRHAIDAMPSPLTDSSSGTAVVKLSRASDASERAVRAIVKAAKDLRIDPDDGGQPSEY